MWVPLSIVRCFDKHRMIDYDRMNLISLNLILSSEVRWQGALGMVWIPKEICHPFFVFKGSYSMWVNYSLHWYGIKIKLGLCHLVKTTCFGVSIIECVCVISFEIYCIWPENGIHIAYVYITTFHFWSSDAKLPFKSSWNSPIFPIFFPSKCHPAIQLLHFNFPPLKLPVFEKEKFTPLKKKWEKNQTLTTHPAGWASQMQPGSDFLGAYWACLASLTQGGQWTVTRMESPGVWKLRGFRRPPATAGKKSDT